MLSLIPFRSVLDVARRLDAIAICALTVVTCTVVLAARHRPRPSLADELRAELATALDVASGDTALRVATRPALDAYVVFQLADCSGNLRVLDLLRRRSVSRHVTIAGLVFAGSADELDRARPRLPLSARALPIRRTTRASTELLDRLGYRSTPIVVVLDARRRVRFITSAPSSALAYVRLARLLPNLDDADAP